jgi:hypothetical protein
MVHKYTFYYYNKKYSDGYDRIFGKKAKHENNELQEQGSIQKVAGLRTHAQGLSRKNGRKNKRPGAQGKTQVTRHK